jgi:hypothetical protein
VPRPDTGSLLAELLYEQQAEVNQALPGTVLAGDDRQPALLVHEGHGHVDPIDGPAVPVMSVLKTADDDDQLKDPDRIDLSQTWEFPQAQAVLGRCRSALTVGEMLGLPPPCGPRGRVHERLRARRGRRTAGPPAGSRAPAHARPPAPSSRPPGAAWAAATLHFPDQDPGSCHRR